MSNTETVKTFIKKDLWYVTIRPARPAIPNFNAEQDICKTYPYQWYCNEMQDVSRPVLLTNVKFYAKYLNIFYQVMLQKKTSNLCMRCSYPMSQPNETPKTFLTWCQCQNKMLENVLPSSTAKWEMPALSHKISLLNEPCERFPFSVSIYKNACKMPVTQHQRTMQHTRSLLPNHSVQCKTL